MTEPTRDFPQDAAAAYVLGALAPEEMRAFERLLAQRPELQREVLEFRELVALLAVGTKAPTPAAGVRDRVLTRIGQEQSPGRAAPARATRRTFVWGALAASAFAAVGLGIAASQLSHQLTETRGALVNSEQTLTELRRHLADRESTLSAIFRPTVDMFQLTASGNPEPRIQIFWDRERHRALIRGTRLKPLPADSAYQLWFIRDGKPVPSVTFSPALGGDALVDSVLVPSDGTISAAAVTIEPAAGSPAPTSSIVMSGSLAPGS